MDDPPLCALSQADIVIVARGTNGRHPARWERIRYERTERCDPQRTLAKETKKFVDPVVDGHNICTKTSSQA